VTASQSSKTFIGAGSSARRCCTPSTCWSSEARTCGRSPSRIGSDSSLIGRRSLGIVLSQNTDEDIFHGVCRMGLEGVVSKRLSSRYRSGRSTDWLKIKNPESPAMVRTREGEC
jgi:hypothetical protein